MSLECETKPGQLPVYKSKDGLTLAIGMEPTWIKLPPELSGASGRKVSIKETFIAKVCKCGKHPAKVLILDCDYMVVECLTIGYMWMTKPSNIEGFKRLMQ